jgi:DNA-directed RNA polymerase delta subunit
MMKKHGSPMHFREVAKAIVDTFGRKTHVATTHNELIKDSRFVLVGRGYYALEEWGYKPGVVRDVIAEILIKEGPLGKEEVVDRVLKERFLKKNTILVNLQNPKYFIKLSDGRYTVVKK